MLPKAIGPYSLFRFSEARRMLFISGQLGIDTESGQLATGIEQQTRRVMENIKAILEANGLSMGDIIKTTIFLTNVEDFPKVNEIYSTYLPEPFPARTTVIVKALPKNALVEIEAIATATL